MGLPARLTIQSKLLLMLLGVSLVSIAVTAWIGYQNGKESLTERVRDQLTAQRVSRTTQVKGFFEQLRSQTLSLAESPVTVDALKALDTGYRQYESVELKPEQQQNLKQYYDKEFVPSIKNLIEGEPVIENLIPATNAGKNLQYHYLATNKNAKNRAVLEDARDGSNYSAAHARFHPPLSRLLSRAGYYDLFLISSEGNVVYTVQKEIDLGANLNSGPLANTNLARAFRTARDANQRGFYKLVDFERYLPSRTVPAAFIAAPVFDGNVFAGVVALQVPSEQIDAIMSGARNWENEGLGKTGEAYLVGPDFLLRNNTRFLLDDPTNYVKTLIAAGVPANQVKRIDALKTSILEQSARTELAQLALRNEVGQTFAVDYRGKRVIGSYGPSDLNDLGWGVVAKIDEAEAFAPVREFGRKVLTYALLLQIGITLAALFFARLFLRPIEQLMDGAKAIGSGKLDTQVEVGSRDEFHDLAIVFNDTTRKLKEQTIQTELTLKRNEELLLNILPGTVARRLNGGEDKIADAVPSVTVMFASITGFDELTSGHAAQVAVEMLNELIGAFDEAAERLGVEKVKTIGAAYLAVAGLNIAAIDHPGRVLEFARELRQIVKKFNLRHQTQLSLSVGVNTGPVMAGVVGRSKFIYDLWGDTVSMVQTLQKASPPDSIVVTETTHQRTKSDFGFERLPDAQLPGKGALTAYRLSVQADA
jgi:class 3 adenylate cyclase